MADGIHTPEQLKEKRDAVTDATARFVQEFREGQFDKNRRSLVNAIENLNSLVVELKRG